MISDNDFVILHPHDINDIKWKKKIIQYSDQVIILGDPKELSSITNKENDNYRQGEKQ